MSEKTVAEKARIKPSTTIAVLNRVAGVVESLGLPEEVTFVEPAEAQLVFLFVSTRAELEAQMPPAVAGLAPEAALWVFYRKGSKSAGLDMNRDSIWAIAETWACGRWVSLASTTRGRRSGYGPRSSCRGQRKGGRAFSVTHHSNRSRRSR